MLEIEEWENGCGFNILISEHDAEEIYHKLEQTRNPGDIIQGSNYDNDRKAGHINGTSD